MIKNPNSFQQTYKRMEKLILYLYEKHIHSKDPNAKTFSKLQPIKVYALTQEQLEFYNTMLIRNFFAYSASTMELKLSLKHLMGLYRLHQFQKIMSEAGLASIYKEWIQNQLMPVSVQNNKSLANSPYVYIDYKQQKQDKNKQAEPQIELKRTSSKNKGKQKSTKKHQPQATDKKQLNSKVITMVNVLELTSRLENQVLTTQLGNKSLELKNADRRAEAIQKYQQIKIEQYVSERFGMETLMVFNFIRKYPYLDEKQLLAKTMLSANDLRKSFAHLISDGLVTFYPQSARSVLFKAMDKQRIKQKFCDHLAHSMLNLLIFLQNQSKIEEQKKLAILQSLSNLDKILMIFTA